MKLFGVPLKLMEQMGLTDSQEYQILHNDVKKWELEKATEDSEDPIGRFYYKVHEGVLARLLIPFLYVLLMKEVKRIFSNEDSEEMFE
ncbi:hypothetical protein [uncultured Winogradskyella sp.]|uniref:hypothetical protein n=1 Tax=uncultured Winogradskyella sp. TaxID=395353 RepID=UPI002625169D|nr:hypothetical protein [uncultured Winogradskyella sp.]